jgi:hypothetical protein
LDISGTETYVAAAARGLTMGGYFYPEEAGTFEMVMTKWNAAGNQRSYALDLRVANTFSFRVSDNGVALDVVFSAAVSMGAWYFIVGRFDPAVEVNIWIDETETVQATARASVFNGNADFAIGAASGGISYFQGRASLCFLCAAYLSDEIIRGLFAATRGLFRKW